MHNSRHDPNKNTSSRKEESISIKHMQIER
jgi:hypothetical protein